MRGRSSCSRSSYSPSSSVRRFTPSTTPSKRTPQQTPRSQLNPSVASGFFSSMVNGMGLRTGIEFVQYTFRGFMGWGSPHPIEEAQPEQVRRAQNKVNACAMENAKVVECLKLNSNGVVGCQNYLNAWRQCEIRMQSF